MFERINYRLQRNCFGSERVSRRASKPELLSWKTKNEAFHWRVALQNENIRSAKSEVPIFYLPLKTFPIMICVVRLNSNRTKELALGKNESMLSKYSFSDRKPTTTWRSFWRRSIWAKMSHSVMVEHCRDTASKLWVFKISKISLNFLLKFSLLF